MGLNAFTSKTAKNLQLDAGILVKNHTIGQEITEGNKIGATSGGATFTAVPEFRNIFDDIDGARGMYKSGMVIDSWDITLSATIKEITLQNLKLALATSEESAGDGEFSTSHKKLTPRNQVKDSDYIGNLCWIGTINDESQTQIVIELKNVLNTNGLNFTATDKGTGAIAIELKAHFDLDNPDEVPFTIHVPNPS